MMNDIPHSAVAERTREVAGVRARYLEAGSGAPVILLHGASLGSSSDVWEKTLPDFAARGFHAIAPDLPGFGGTPVADDHTISDRRRFVLDFLDALALSAAHLVGHSQAGRIVVEIALERPQRVMSALVLGTGSLLPPDPDGKQAEGEEGTVIESTVEQTRALLESNLFHRELATDAAVALRHRMSIGAPFAAFRARKSAPREKAGGLWRRLVDVRVPLLLLYGRDDRGNAAARAAQARQMFPELDVRVLPDCKHLIQWDAREALADIAGEFMARAAKTR